MAVKHLSYLDIAPAQRAKGAERARQQLRAQLGNPFLTPDQVLHLHEQMRHLAAWEKGLVNTAPNQLGK